MAGPAAFLHTARTPARPCPICRRVLDGATSVSLNPADPRPTLAIDDLTRCAHCGAILVLTPIGFRIATSADLAGLDPTLRAVLLAWDATKGQH